jgi:UDP-N-acetylglucosamine 1-carboxyvinyltransferase
VLLKVYEYHIAGGKRLSGETTISGAKNSLLPILAATIMNGNMNVIKDCPNLKDVETMLKILKAIGCKTEFTDNVIAVDSKLLDTYIIPDKLVSEMRSSVFLLGPMLTRCGRVDVTYPGGCEIGPRPIDLHLKVLKQLGVHIEEGYGHLKCSVEKLKGATIQLDFPSVGATENAMLLAVKAEGVTRVKNAAKEPEIVDLQNFLNEMGAKVTGAGTSEITIYGVESLHEAHHTVIPDRICAGTILAAAAITGGEVFIKNVVPEHLGIILSKFAEAGCLIREEEDAIYLKSPERIQSVEMIRTLPYPGFPTDMQSQFLVLMAIAEGTAMISETIFENRFKVVDEIARMGAKIKVEGRVAVITGVEKLHGAVVNAKDLRGGAALVLAGLAAQGNTIVKNIYHIDRGYDKLEAQLTQIGAQIVRKKQE